MEAITSSSVLLSGSDGGLQDESSPPAIRSDPRRWLVLAVFWSHMLFANLAWVTFNPIADFVHCYYSVSLFAVNVLAWIGMSSYLVGFLPATLFLNAFGVKLTLVVGCTCLTAASWLRFAGSNPDYFWLLLLGNIVASVQGALSWGACSQFSSVWFPPHERTLATSVTGSLGAQVGILMGLVVGPIVLPDSGAKNVCSDNVSRSSAAFQDWQSSIYQRLFYYLLAQALFISAIFFITFMFPEAPHSPPSYSRSIKDKLVNQPSTLQSYLQVLRNPFYVFSFLVFGLFVGSAGAFVSVYAELLDHTGYSDYQHFVGYLGIGMQVLSSVGVLITSRWLDLTKSFYLTSLCLATGCSLATICLVIFYELKLPFLAVSIPVVLIRGLLICFQPVAFEHGAEMTFPLPESISNSLINFFNQLQSMSEIIATSLFLQYGLPKYSGVMFAILFVLGTLALVFIKPELRRAKLDLAKDSARHCKCCGLSFYKRNKNQ